MKKFTWVLSKLRRIHIGYIEMEKSGNMICFRLKLFSLILGNIKPNDISLFLRDYDQASRSFEIFNIKCTWLKTSLHCYSIEEEMTAPNTAQR